MTTRLLPAVCALVAACSGPTTSGPSPLVTGLEGAPASIQDSCQLAAKRCVRCHSVERITRLQVVSPVHWQRYVMRMRLQPDSGIGPREGDDIARCLVYRSFGARGIAELQSGVSDE